MKERRLTILYGSQTGTSQEIAERIWREGKRYYFTGPVQSMDDYPITHLISESVVVFICSTTGQGEEPDNMKQSWKFLLKKSIPLDSLKTVRFAVLGLGDSSYVKFNFVAKRLNRRLEQLGGQSLIDIGLADDQHDLGADAVTDPWIDRLWEKLAQLYPLPSNVKPLGNFSLSPPRWKVSVVGPDEAPTSGEENVGVGEPSQLDGHQYSQCKPCLVTVLANTRTTSKSHFQDVRLLKLSSGLLRYSPGDVAMVRPRNPAARVEELFRLLPGLHADTRIVLSETDGDMPVPRGLDAVLTLRQCAEQHWDLNAVPRRYLFHLLSHFTTDDLEREKLTEFTSAEGQEELYSYCNRPRRSVLEVLADFPHTAPHIPLGYLFEVFTPIRPRAFSIASSPKAHCGELHLLVAVVQYRTVLLAPRRGLCSNWLASLVPGDEVPVWVRGGSFRFPASPDVPVIMVGPGTGVAPFRSFVWERAALNEATKDSLHLFFGCRNRAGDFHCREEWLLLAEQGKLSLRCAFSRDQEHKVYVQHEIGARAAELWELIADRGAIVCLAGNSKDMPDAVRQAFVGDVVSGVGGLTEQQAERLLAGRYQTETWG